MRNILALKIPLNRQLIAWENKLNELLINKVGNLLEERNKIIFTIEPHNYKNSQVVGGILTQDAPVKPRKYLVIVASFLISIMLAIFLVFALDLFDNLKE